jgi:hypothetical protein
LAELLKAQGQLTVSGAGNETAKALILSHVLSFDHHPTLVLTEQEEVESLSHWLHFFEHPASMLPSLPAEGEGMSSALLQGFHLFMRGEHGVFLAPREAWDYPFPLYKELLDRTLTLKEGDELPFTQFVED